MFLQCLWNPNIELRSILRGKFLTVFRVHVFKQTVLWELNMNFPGYVCLFRYPNHSSLDSLSCITRVARQHHLNSPRFNLSTLMLLEKSTGRTMWSWEPVQVTSPRKFCLFQVDNPRILHLFIRIMFWSLVPFLVSACFKCSKAAVCLGQGSTQASILKENQPRWPIPLCVAPQLLIFFWILIIWFSWGALVEFR